MDNSLRNIIHNCKEIYIPYLRVFSTNKTLIEMPKSDNPYIYIIAEGSIRLHTPSGIMDYISGQYSVSAIDTPMKAEVIAFSILLIREIKEKTIKLPILPNVFWKMININKWDTVLQYPVYFCSWLNRV